MVRLGCMSRRVASSGMMACCVQDNKVSAKRKFRDVFAARTWSHTSRYSLLSTTFYAVIDCGGVIYSVSDFSDHIGVLTVSIDRNAEKNNWRVFWHPLSGTDRPELPRFFWRFHLQKGVGWGDHIKGIFGPSKLHISVPVFEKATIAEQYWEECRWGSRHFQISKRWWKVWRLVSPNFRDWQAEIQGMVDRSAEKFSMERGGVVVRTWRISVELRITERGGRALVEKNAIQTRVPCWKESTKTTAIQDVRLLGDHFSRENISFTNCALARAWILLVGSIYTSTTQCGKI